MKKIVRSKNNWLRTSQIVTAFVMGSMLLTTVHAKSDRNRGEITLEVAKVDGECRVLIQSEKPISNVILNLGLVDEEKIEYLYEEQDDGSVTSSPIGNTYDLGEYVVGSALEDDYETIHVKAGNNGKRGVGENVIDYEVTVAEECAVKTYEIGKKGPGGGIVFRVPDVDLPGLEAAPAPGEGVQDPVAIWCATYNFTGATGTAIGTGAANTLAILDATNGCADTAGIAASVAAEYSTNVNGQEFTDWFLPSKDELNAMHENIGQGCGMTIDTNCDVGGFAFDLYWSSSEFDSNAAWSQYFFNGLQFGANKTFTLRVRAVRAF